MKYINFNSQGSALCAKVLSEYEADFDYNGEKVQASKENAKLLVEIPGGQKLLVDKSVAAPIEESDFNKQISSLVFSLAKTHEVKIMTEDQFKSEVAKLEAEIAKLNDSLKSSASEVATLTEAKEKAEKDKEAMKEEVEKMKRKEMASERLSQVSKLGEGAVAFVAEDESKAKEDLAEMSDKEFARLVNMVTAAMKKSNQHTMTAIPNSDTRTVTPLPNSNNVSVASEEGLNGAKVEESNGDSVASVAAGSSEGNEEDSAGAALIDYSRQLLGIKKK
jgi:hypothetical protein